MGKPTGPRLPGSQRRSAQRIAAELSALDSDSSPSSSTLGAKKKAQSLASTNAQKDRKLQSSLASVGGEPQSSTAPNGEKPPADALGRGVSRQSTANPGLGPLRSTGSTSASGLPKAGKRERRHATLAEPVPVFADELANAYFTAWQAAKRKAGMRKHVTLHNQVQQDLLACDWRTLNDSDKAFDRAVAEAVVEMLRGRMLV